MSKFFSGPTPRLFAHRGASGEAPENTLAAFQRAASLGVVYMELDVHLSRDGQVVVMHDDTLERTTNGRGLVKEHGLAELYGLDAGYHFTPDGGETFPFRGQGVSIPLLADVLRRFPHVRFTVEIKQQEPPIEEQVIAVVRECGMAETVILASEARGGRDPGQKPGPGYCHQLCGGGGAGFYAAGLQPAARRLPAARPGVPDPACTTRASPWSRPRPLPPSTTSERRSMCGP